MNAAVLELTNPGDARGVARPEPLAQALSEHLEDLRRLLATLGGPAVSAADRRDLYCVTPSSVSGSVGGHVRHILDHVSAWLACDGSPDLWYDSRLRGTLVERDPAAAIAEVDRLREALGRIDGSALALPVRLASVIRRDGAASQVFTTRAREAIYVIQHTVHHAAVIAILLERLGVGVPPGFGYAASTPLPASH